LITGYNSGISALPTNPNSDINGDGKADIVGFGNTSIFTTLSNGNGTFQGAINFAPNSGTFTKNNGWTTFNDYPRVLGDVNGDGKADIVGFGNNYVYTSLGNGNGTFQNVINSIPNSGAFTKNNAWTSFNDYPRMLADVNGDGKADIVGFGNDYIFTALSNGNGTFQTPINFSPNGAKFTKNQGWTSFNDYPRMLADVNGDGKADIVGFGNDYIFTALSNGNGTFQTPISFSPNGAKFTKNQGWTSFNDYPRMLADVNGDGKADVVGFGNDHVFTALSNGNGTFQDTIISYTGFTKNQGGWTNFNDYPRMLADVNGDRKADLVAFGNDNVFVALNNGNGTFQSPVSSSPSGVGFTKNKGGWSTFNEYPRLIGNGFGISTPNISYYPNIETTLRNFFSNTANIPIASRVENWSSKTITQMWDRVGGESAQFPTDYASSGDLWQVNMPIDLYNIYKDLSTAIFGGVRTVTTGYAYDSGYYATNGAHSALDIDDGDYAAVRSAVRGKVVRIVNDGTRGYAVAIDELDSSNAKTGRRWWYAHVTNVRVSVGNIITSGTQIAQLHSANNFPEHLHLTVVNTYSDTVNYSETVNAKTGNYANDVQTILNRTMSPLQAYWKSRNGIKE